MHLESWELTAQATLLSPLAARTSPSISDLFIDHQPSLVSHVQKKHNQGTKEPFESVNASLDYLHHEEIFEEHEFTQKKKLYL